MTDEFLKGLSEAQRQALRDPAIAADVISAISEAQQKKREAEEHQHLFESPPKFAIVSRTSERQVGGTVEVSNGFQKQLCDIVRIIQHGDRIGYFVLYMEQELFAVGAEDTWK